MFVTDLAKSTGRSPLRVCHGDGRRKTPSKPETVVVAPPSLPVGPPSVVEKVRARKRRLEEERDDCSERQDRLAELRAERDACTARHQIKRRRELERLIQAEEGELAATASGARVQEFVEAAAPYLKAYQRQQFCRPQAEVLRDQASSPRSREPPVAVDYAAALEGAAPRFRIETRDACACGEPLQLHTALSRLVCVRCGATQPYLDATASLLAYSDDSYDYCSFSYKRINHFVDWISAMQGKESTEIPEEVLEQVMSRLVDERVERVEDVTVPKVREVLKKLKLKKYYDHTQLITTRITGRAPPRMTPAMEERIKLLFMAASSAFQQHCPPNRSSFLSYSFVLHKFCQLLGYTEFLPYFSLLKGRENLMRQDQVFKQICESLDWEFIPSV